MFCSRQLRDLEMPKYVELLQEPFISKFREKVSDIHDFVQAVLHTAPLSPFFVFKKNLFDPVISWGLSGKRRVLSTEFPELFAQLPDYFSPFLFQIQIPCILRKNRAKKK
jgi:hypothetical protein